jgi:hypothetical protein
MSEELLPADDVVRRAQEAARRLMSTPPQPRVKPKPARSAPDDASKPRTPSPAGEES